MMFIMNMTEKSTPENLLKNLWSMELEPMRPEMIKIKRLILNMMEKLKIYMISLVLIQSK